MFSIKKSDTGAVQPWEYLATAETTLTAGRLMNVNSSGQVANVSAAAAAAPAYLCMREGAPEDGLAPVQRITGDAIYETQLSAAIAGLKVGSVLKVAADGQTVAAAGSGESGCFEIVSYEGTGAGDTVTGRFV